MSNKLFPTLGTPITPVSADRFIVGDASDGWQIKDVTYSGMLAALTTSFGTKLLTAEQIAAIAGIDAAIAAAIAALDVNPNEWHLVEKKIKDSDGDEAIADGKDAFAVPAALNLWELKDAMATVHSKGVTGTTDIQLRRVRVEAVLGDATTQFDITDQTGNVFRYTYDGTGTDPVIADSLASLKANDQIDIQAQNFNALNNGLFVIVAVGENYFEVSNASGAAESDKTIGTGSITPIKHRDMLSTKITIGDEFFAADGVINTSYDDLKTGDKVYIDVDAIHTGTAAKGLSVSMKFQEPSA